MREQIDFSKTTQIKCEKCGFLLDVEYDQKPSTKLKEIFYQRRSRDSIYNESGVWRFRELLNFTEIETEELELNLRITPSLQFIL